MGLGKVIKKEIDVCHTHMDTFQRGVCEYAADAWMNMVSNPIGLCPLDILNNPSSLRWTMSMMHQRLVESFDEVQAGTHRCHRGTCSIEKLYRNKPEGCTLTQITRMAEQILLTMPADVRFMDAEAIKYCIENSGLGFRVYRE